MHETRMEPRGNRTYQKINDFAMLCVWIAVTATGTHCITDEFQMYSNRYASESPLSM